MSESTAEYDVVELTAEQTHPLRRAVLRNGDPEAPVVYPEDDWPGAVHLGLRRDGEVLATSSWVAKPYPDAALLPAGIEPIPAVQLRGMATSAVLQGTGLGGVLLEAGCARAAAAGVPLVWARARDTAMVFYERHGFTSRGDGFIDQTSGLPHHLVDRRVR